MKNQKSKNKKVLIELDPKIWKEFKILAKKKYGLVKKATEEVFTEWISKNKE